MLGRSWSFTDLVLLAEAAAQARPPQAPGRVRPWGRRPPALPPASSDSPLCPAITACV